MNLIDCRDTTHSCSYCGTYMGSSMDDKKKEKNRI